MTKKASKSATTKKAFQDALKKKAAEKAASSNVLKPDAPVEVTSPEVEASPKHNEEAFKKALELLLCTYPADGRNKRSDFSAVLSLLLKLNVDTASTKEISVETEKALNILGFTSSKMDGKVSILKEEISDLVVYLFNGYQKMLSILRAAILLKSLMFLRTSSVQNRPALPWQVLPLNWVNLSSS